MTRTMQTDSDFEAVVEAIETHDVLRADSLIAAVAARYGFTEQTVVRAALVEIAA